MGFHVLLRAKAFFVVWMLHGSTKVIVRAVALLSAKNQSKKSQIHWKVFHESSKLETNNETKTPTMLQSPGECRGGWVQRIPRAVRLRAKAFNLCSTILTCSRILLSVVKCLCNDKYIVKTSPQHTGRFRKPSGRALFSDEGGFTFSEAPFEDTLHEGLKGASPSEGFKGASPSEGEAWTGLWRWLQKGLKGASKGLQGGLKGLKPSTLKGALKGASRALEGGFTFGRLQEDWRGLQGGFNGAWRGLRGGLKGLQGGLKGVWRSFTFGRLQAPFKPPSSLPKVKPPSSPLQAPLKASTLKASSPLQAPLKPPPWSPLQVLLKPSEGEAPFKSSPLEAPFSVEGFKPPSSPFEAPLKPSFKPPWRPLQAPFKPPLPKVKPPWSLPKVKAAFNPSWRVPSKGASLKVKPPSSLKGAFPEGARNLPGGWFRGTPFRSASRGLLKGVPRNHSPSTTLRW